MSTVKYEKLIQDFVNRAIDIKDFESRFFQEFKSEKQGMDEKLYQILEDFFEDLDCYDASITSETEDTMNITESTLRKKAQETLSKLKVYSNNNELKTK